MTRKRRYLISAAVLAACLCLALGVLAMLPPRPGVTKANFDRIEKGMTEAEIAAILGEPPSDSQRVTDDGRPIRWYFSDRELVRVIFIDGVAADILFVDGDPMKNKDVFGETVSEKLRRWLHLPE